MESIKVFLAFFLAVLPKWKEFFKLCFADLIISLVAGLIGLLFGLISNTATDFGSVFRYSFWIIFFIAFPANTIFLVKECYRYKKIYEATPEDMIKAIKKYHFFDIPEEKRPKDKKEFHSWLAANNLMNSINIIVKVE